MTSTEFVDCKCLLPGARIDVETRNRHYEIECLGGNEIRISGHPDLCLSPVAGQLHGVDAGVIIPGMHLEFMLADRRPVKTSRVLKVRVARPPLSASVH